MLANISARTFILFPALCMLFLLAAKPAFADLVPFGAHWKYLDDGSDQQNLWQLTDFDDSSWSIGSAQLGYGDGDEATVVSYGPDAGNKHTTTYFRHQFTVTALPAEILTLGIQRDDGVVVYLNGTEVLRDNMPGGIISADTFASSVVSGALESSVQTVSIDPASLLVGANTLAVEIHQSDLASSDISFDLQLTDNAVVRGPYLQQASSTGITIRWRTATSRDAVVRYGTDPLNLDQVASNATISTDQAVELNDLIPALRYFYSIGDSSGDFAASDDQYFDTHPVVGNAAPTRIWVLGDSGTANVDAAAVRDAYIDFNGGAHSDVWLMLGDNAYNNGTDAEYQGAVFDMYPQVLRNSVLWTTLGNHDGYSADSVTQSGPYYDIFTLPTNGESGGVKSSTEAYYSFDYGNIHFVSLDSYETDRSANGSMATWLENDLAANTQEWIIAFWHHPPYSKGSHNSDTELELVEMRANFLPTLEFYGVDLVLGGHSHSYERSMLIDGHYGPSEMFDNTYIVDDGDGDPSGEAGAYNKYPSSNNGSVYTVAGSSGKVSNAPLNHPVMITNLLELGSMVIDVDDKQLDAIFLNSSSQIGDRFRIVHQSPPTTPPNAPSDLTATIMSATEVQLSWADNAITEDSTEVQRSSDQSSWDNVATLGANVSSFTDSSLNPETTYHYRVLAVNAVGSSSPSNIASVTTPLQPPYEDYFANASIAVTGSVSGSLDAIQYDDDAVQSITEVQTGGKPSKRRSMLEHRWQFSLQPGTNATLYANAYSSGSSDGDDFDFDFSTDGGATWQDVFRVSSTDSQHQVAGLLPGGATGSILIRVIDTDRTPGNYARDTVFVDELRIRVGTGAGTPPEAPGALMASAVSASTVNLVWIDNSSDELGFGIERRIAVSGNWSLLETVSADTTSAIDLTAVPGTSYDYRVRAFNDSGTSEYSYTESPVTTPSTAFSLSVSGQKIKGVLHGNLSWTGATDSSIDLYRNSTFISTVDNTGTYTDNTGAKGSATYTYRICAPDSTSECSNEATIAF